MSEEEMLKPIAALLKEDLGSPDRALILGFVENEPNLLNLILKVKRVTVSRIQNGSYSIHTGSSSNEPSQQVKL